MARRRWHRAGACLPCALAAAGLVWFSAGAARAQTEPAREAEPLPPSELRHETGRQRAAEPPADGVRLLLHGEYQARLSALSDLPLRPLPTRPATDSLRQTERLQHWLRTTPVVQLFEHFQVVGQLDLPYGLIAGRETRGVEPADEPLSDRHPLRIDYRWLYVQWQSDAARLRIGQQPSHLGLGMIENDGDHPPRFGDPRGGNRVVRTELSLNPFGRSSPLRIRLAGDLVYRDPFADLGEDEVATRAVLSAHYETTDESFLAVYGAFRHQRNEDDALPGSEFHEELDWFVFDSTGRLRSELPGIAGWAFAEYEAALRLGRTTALRTAEQVRSDEHERIVAYGAMARVGAAATSGTGSRRWARLVGSVEWGWASGDADPYDGTLRRFDFNPNHNVGLILFDEVLHWKTARAAARARDSALVGRAPPGGSLLPSNGAVSGATYLHPSVVVRPVRELDLQLGALLAQSTADVVDPAAVAIEGAYVNYDGGRPDNHDLGLELDAGVEYRLGLPNALTLQLGAQGGVFFPGRAFAGPGGRALGTQALGVGRLGMLY